MGFGEWLSGAGSAVNQFLGGTSGQPVTQGSSAPVMTTDEYAAEAQAVSAPMEPVIPANQSIVTDSKDPTGEYRVIDTDTSAPAKQSFVESYVAPESRVELDRADYTKLADIGDTKTQALMKEGYSPEQATAMQRDEKIAELMSKGYTREQAAESREARYYQTEYDKARQSDIAISSEYHHKALESGLPQAPNPFEYAGDIAKMDIYKSQGVSNLAGTGLLPTYSGSLLEMANLSTKAERTGQMGDYAYLGKPYSSTEGILSLARQQQIGEAAATSKFNKEPWAVDRGAMSEFTPELAKSAGFGLFYKEAKLGGGGTDIANRAIKAADVVGKGKAYDVELEDGTVVKRYESDWDLSNLFPQAKSSPAVTMSKDTVIKSPGITTGTINEYLLPEDRVTFGSTKEVVASVTPVKEAATGVTPVKEVATGVIDAKSMSQGIDVIPKTPYKSAADTLMYGSGIGTPEINIGGTKIGGRFGSGETMGGLTMEKIGISGTPPSAASKYGKMTALEKMRATGQFALARKPKKSVTHVDVKPQKKVSSFYKVTKEQIIPQTIGKDFFKFKINSPKKTFNSETAHEYIKTNITFDADKAGITKSKSLGKKLKLPETNVSVKPKDISGNINDVIKGVTKAVKKSK